MKTSAKLASATQSNELRFFLTSVFVAEAVHTVTNMKYKQDKFGYRSISTEKNMSSLVLSFHLKNM